MAEPSTLTSRFKAELLGQLVAAVSGGLLTVMLARLLEPNDYGLLFFALSVLSALMVLTKLGIGRSAGRYISEYRKTNTSQIPHILRSSLLFNLGTITVVGISLLAGYRILAELLGQPDLASFLLLGTLYVVFGTLAKYIRNVLQGFEAIEAAAAIHALERGGRLLFVIGFVMLGYGALGALGGYIVGSVLVTVIGLGLIYVRFYREYQVDVSIESGLRRRIAEYTLPLTATSTANVLDKSVDTVLVGFFLTPVAVGYYTISKQVIEFVEKPMTALGFTISPTFGAEKADDNLEHARSIYETALVNSLLLYVPAAAGLALVANPLIGFVFGSDYLGAVPVLQVLGVYIVFRTVTHITSHGLDFLGRARARAIAKGITAVLNAVLNVLLIPLIGVVGAAIATAITYGMYTLINVYIIHLEFNLRIGYLVKRLALISGVTLAMSVVVVLLLGYITGWITLGLVIGIGVVVWAALSILVGLMEPREIASVMT